MKIQTLAAVFLLISFQVFSQAKLSIVFIGNSITHGAGLKDPATEAPPVKACDYLRQLKGIGQVRFSNQGVSGFTTVDFLPSTNTVFNKVEAAARAFAETSGLKLGDVAQPLRAAVTGKTTSPPLFEMLALLGREESLIRLRAYGS